MFPSYSKLFKIIIIGDSDVGKSSIISSLVDSKYSPDFQSTIGVDFMVKYMNINNNIYKIQIWDTAGQEKYAPIVKTYFKNIDGIVIVYDVSNYKSFNNLTKWLKNIDDNVLDKNIPKVLLGNKIDKIKNHNLFDDFKVGDFANKNNLQFFETSARNNTNIDQAFLVLLNKMIEKNTIKIDDAKYINIDDNHKPSALFCCV